MAVSLTASTGRITGSRPSTRLRDEGQIPGVVYGLGADSVTLSVAWPDLRRALSTEAGLNALIDLEVDGSVTLSIVKELQRHPVRRDVLHVDFLRLDPDADLAVEVPVLLEGEAIAVIRENAIVDQALHHLSILVKPALIPDSLSLDISDLEVGGVLTVSDIVLPAGVRTELADDEAVVSAYVPRRTAALLAADEAAAEAAAGEGEEGEGEDGEGEEGAADGDADAGGGSGAED